MLINEYGASGVPLVHCSTVYDLCIHHLEVIVLKLLGYSWDCWLED